MNTKEIKGASPQEIGLFVILLILATLIVSAGGTDVKANRGRSGLGATNGTLDLGLSVFASGLNRPLGAVGAGDSRLFVIEQDGFIKIVQSDGTVLGTPFLNISDRVNATSDEMGLLGAAFHPNYASNGYFYVNYTSTAGGARRTRISRFSVSANPNVADENSEEILLTVNQPYTNHNAGHIMFGVDGFLYIPLGDGGSGGDPSNNAQTLTTILGKINRIDVDSGPGASEDCSGTGTGNYTIPNSNPFIDGPGNNCDEIWAAGVRNPWRSSFDRQTDDLYVGDVGQGIWEEIDFQPSNSPGGENYGWRCYEGSHPYNLNGCLDISNYTFPIFEYNHSGNGCAIIGGYVYRGSRYPTMVGHYLLTDYCSGNFWDLVADGGGGWVSTKHTNLARFGITAIGEATDGELYVVQRSGTVYHLEENTVVVTPTPSSTPTNTPTATPTIVITPVSWGYLPIVGKK